jgi:polysaccharide biosynthesis transport protein
MISAEPNTQPAGGPIEFWQIVRRRKGVLILFAFSGAAIGYLLTLLQTPMYQARTSIEIVGLNDNFLNTKQVKPVTETGSTAEIADLQTQIKILLSESLLGRVLEKLAGQFPLLALKDAQKGVTVHGAGQSRILEIGVDSADPAMAANFANTLSGEFISQNLEARRKTTDETSRWLNQQLEDMRLKLERSEDRLQAYARQSGLMFTAEQVSVLEDELGRLQRNLSAAQADRIAKQSRYEISLGSPPEALPDVLNDESLRDYRAKLTELRRQIAELEATYTTEHPKVMRAQAQLSIIWSALERERGDILKRIENEYEESKRKAMMLTNAYTELARRAGAESEKAIKYRILKREVDSNRQLYDTMLQQLKQSDIAAAMRASNVRVIDAARIPARPYKPDAPLNAGLGLLTGVALGIGFVVLRERGDRSIQQPGDTPLYLNLPELGVIPSTRGDRVELITWRQKPSLTSESFRSTFLSIQLAKQAAQVLVVSSAEPLEGKSTVASNLGIAIAETGRQVLLIDADLRKPKLHDVFGLANERGLSGFLNARGSAGFLGLIQETKVPRLSIITSGPGSGMVTSLLHGPQMPELLRRLRAEFEIILIDTPPMLQLPDARVLGRMADQVILVVRSGKTSRDAAMAAKQRFSEDGTRVLGTILNNWNPKSSPNGFYNTSYKSFSKHYASRSARA